jgi:hypothetical protein
VEPSKKTRGVRHYPRPICFDGVAGPPAVLAAVLRPARRSTGRKRAYCLFQSNSARPGLQFKELGGEDDIYSARIGLDYRALAVAKQGRVVWYWIGSHSDYDHSV